MTFETLVFPVCLLLFCGIDFALAQAEQRQAMLRKWPLHGGLALAGQLVTFFVPLSGIIASNTATARGFGLGPFIRPLGWPVEFLVWILSLTLAVYAVHFALHRFHALWAFHRIHHCDESLEASTAIRHHPLENISSILTVSAMAFLITPSASVLLAAFVVTMVIDLFNHSRIRLPDRFSTMLEWVIVTPRLHHVHHSPLAHQTDSNYGGTFTFWDRIFGTFCGETPAGMGLDHKSLAGANSRDFDTLIVEPFKYLWHGRKSG